MSSDYLAGKKVYNGGLPNAQSGTRDPSGYIDRTMRQRSERRSGLAATATRMVNKRISKKDEPPKVYPTQHILRHFGQQADDTGKIRSIR